MSRKGLGSWDLREQGGQVRVGHVKGGQPGSGSSSALNAVGDGAKLLMLNLCVLSSRAERPSPRLPWSGKQSHDF